MGHPDRSNGVRLVTDPVRFDFQIRDEGTLVLLWPISALAVEWVDEHLPEDTPTWGDALCIESRYALDIVRGLREDGLLGRVA